MLSQNAPNSNFCVKILIICDKGMIFLQKASNLCVEFELQVSRDFVKSKEMLKEVSYECIVPLSSRVQNLPHVWQDSCNLNPLR